MLINQSKKTFSSKLIDIACNRISYKYTLYALLRDMDYGLRFCNMVNTMLDNAFAGMCQWCSDKYLFDWI